MNKHPIKSVTIWSQLLILVSVFFLANAPEPLTTGFTTDQLCDWAIAIGDGQKTQFIMMIIVSCNLIGIWGWLRANKGDK